MSETYLLKHLKAMVKAGLLESVPGPRGGYRLGRSAGEMTLLDIVDAVEGKAPSFRCQEIRACGPLTASPEACRRAPCAINAAMLSAERIWRDALRTVTLESLAESASRSIAPERREEISKWLADRVR